jgi:hypothetical protein
MGAPEKYEYIIFAMRAKHRCIYDAYIRISVTPLIKTASLTEDAFAISHVERGGVL